MDNHQVKKLSLSGALRLEFLIIALGIVALFMIFQPFSLTVFSIGCGLVVVAALANNLLPLSEPGMPIRKILWATVVVLLIFFTALLVSIAAAHLYGMLFLKAPAVSLLVKVASKPFWAQPLYWGITFIDVVLWFVVFRLVEEK
ncbi:MAG: hypothetical protein QM488_00610 [Rhizobiaceae bacterium]